MTDSSLLTPDPLSDPLKVGQSDHTPEIALRVSALSKTFYSGFFAPIPKLRERSWGRLHRVVHAVSEVSFSIPRGQIFALLGANGAGKSTTMKAIMGLIRPTRGQIELFGVNANQARARRRVGYLPENPNFYDELTPTELMRLFCKMSGIKASEVTRHSAELLDRVGISYAASRPLRKLSKGMHQRVGIAQALIGAPDLIVLDEPFSGLDPIGRREIREVLFTERERGATLLFSSHILPDVEALCDHFLVLEHGRVRHQGELGELSGTGGDVELLLTRASAELKRALNELTGAQDTSERRRASDLGYALTSLQLPSDQSGAALALIHQHVGELYAMQRVRPPLEELFVTPDLDVSSSQTAPSQRERTLLNERPVEADLMSESSRDHGSERRKTDDGDRA